MIKLFNYKLNLFICIIKNIKINQDNINQNKIKWNKIK
jgi:hypothetical protein